MSDEGDRSCPLCAEEMDLTDQQLKPCKCGYEICVWCWHHIMDMAEKDQTQGRCPACRTPYNKEKIVGTAAHCERLVAEMNMEKKMKSQKTKSKISVDGRKQLGSVRVIQRNLVYIVGLPLTLADEDLLHHKDYFGQYGRVLKISISRTAAGSIQQFANNTCSVYITYSKEEEAVRCIQSVHGFVLDGRPLRACFGTTKYCHAWLRNVPCTNPDCLYLHEIGTQEDRYSKDEIVSAYSRVQQITSATSNMQRRSGNVLPPPADECHINSSTLTRSSIGKSPANNATTNVNGCPPKSTSGQYAALPSATSWGAHASNDPPQAGNLAQSNGPSKLKPGTCSTAVAAAVEVPHVHAEERKKLISNEESQNHLHKGEQQPRESGSRQHPCKDSNVAAHGPPVQLRCPLSPMDRGRGTGMAPSKKASMELSGRSCSPCSNKDPNISGQENNDNLPSAFASMNVTGLGAEHSADYRSNSNTASLPVNHGQQQCYTKEFTEPSASIAQDEAISLTDDTHVSREQSNPKPGFLTRKQHEGGSNLQTLGVETESQVVFSKVGQHLQSLKEQKANDPESVPNTSNFSNTCLSSHYSNLSNVRSPTQTEHCDSACLIQDPSKLDNGVENGLQVHPSGISAVFNGYPEDIVNSYRDPDASLEHSYLRNKLLQRSECEAVNAEQSVATGMGESSIISNILSLDLDPWDESSTSPRNLVKLLGEADKCQIPLAPSNSWKAQNSNKSRFSFARPDESRELSSHSEASFGQMAQMFKENPSSHDFEVNRDHNFDKFGDFNGSSAFNMEESDNFAGTYSYLSSSKLSGSRSQASVPPGFSLANKAPPPGFSSHERTGPNFDSISGSHFLDTSSLLGNSYQSPQTENISSSASTDIEFMDPAILAVGKGRLPVGLNNGVSLDMRFNSSPQMNAVESEAFQLLMQRSSPPIQNVRFPGVGNGFGPCTDTQILPSRIMEQSFGSSLSPFSQVGIQQSRGSMMSNGQWNGWNEGKTVSEMGIAELLRIETLGFNSFHGGYEDSKFCMPSSGEIYSRTYGI